MYSPYSPPYFPLPVWPHPSCPQWPIPPQSPTVDPVRPQPLAADASPASRLVPGDFANVTGATPTATSPAPIARQDLQTTYASLLQLMRKLEQDSLSNDPAIAKAAKRKANTIGLFFGGVLEGAGLIPAGSFEGALTGDKKTATASEAIQDVLDSSSDPTRMNKAAFALHAAGFVASFVAAVALLLEPF